MPDKILGCFITKSDFKMRPEITKLEFKSIPEDTTKRTFNATTFEDPNDGNIKLRVTFKYLPVSYDLVILEPPFDDEFTQPATVVQNNIDAATDDEIEETIPRLNFEALAKCSIIKLDAASNTFIATQLISVEDEKNATPATKKVLTYTFYCNALLQGRMKLSEIYLLGKKQAKTLTNENIITLLELGILTLQTAKQLSTPQRELIINPFYFAGLINRKFQLQELININLSQGMVINHPFIINLIEKGIITLSNAKQISMKSLNRMEFSKMIAWLIKEKILAPNEAEKIIIYGTDGRPCEVSSSISEEKKQFFKTDIMPHFLDLAAKELLYESDLCALCNDFFAENNSEKMEIEDKQDNTKDSFIKKMNDAAQCNLYCRLQEVLLGTPRKLHNDVKDNMQKIRKGYKQFNADFIKLRDQVIENELNDLFLIAKKIQIWSSSNMYNSIADIIQKAEASSNTNKWYTVVNQIAELAKTPSNSANSLPSSSIVTDNKMETASRKRKLADDKKHEDNPSKIQKTSTSSITTQLTQPASASAPTAEEPLVNDEAYFFEKICSLANILKNDTPENINEITIEPASTPLSLHR